MSAGSQFHSLPRKLTAVLVGGIWVPLAQQTLVDKLRGELACSIPSLGWIPSSEASSGR